jgi:reactive intermediate/imine deaminase
VKRTAIQTDAAPAAIGPYSQAIRQGDTLYISGQIPLDPASGKLVDGDITAQINQVFDNLTAIAEAAGGSLQNALKINVYLTDLSDFAAVNQIMADRLVQPYPARATIGVAALPLGADVEADAILAV